MKLKLISAASVLIYSIVVTLAMTFVMMLAMNGYSESDATAGMILFFAGSLVTAALGAYGAFWMTGRLAARGRRPFVAFAVAVVPLLFLIGTAEVVLAFSGIIMTENVRKSRVVSKEQ